MAESTLTKVGNSAAAFIPRALREKAGVDVGDSFAMESPRQGVVVLRFHRPTSASKLRKLELAERRIKALAEGLPAWDESLTADQLIREGKEMRSHEVLPS